jgi:ferredoxin-NADP reductase
MIVKKPYSITAIIKTTPDVTFFKFKAVDGSKLDFEPGMFIMLAHKDEQTGVEIARAFSLASSPNAETIDFMISMVHGRFTSYLDTAKVGDIYYVTGPHGQFKLDSTENKKVLFLAGGTGIAPFLSMFYYIKEKGFHIDINTLYSVRHPDEIILKEELDKLTHDLNMKTVITVTRPDNAENWLGEKGHINSEMISRNIPDFAERECYICGPLNFVKALKAALTELNISNDRIKADVWG